MTNETPEQRQKRFVDEIAKELDVDLYQDEPYQSIAHGIFDALLAAYEPPIAAMVRRGVQRLYLEGLPPYEAYRPRPL